MMDEKNSSNSRECKYSANYSSKKIEPGEKKKGNEDREN